MKLLREQWSNMDARAKAPYEARATHDANRYRREVLHYMLICVYLLSFLPPVLIRGGRIMWDSNESWRKKTVAHIGIGIG